MARPHFVFRSGDFRLDLGRQTKIMGILNLTPDSFSLDGILPNSRDNLKKAIALGKKLIADGADILDIGGESTRPGAQKISAQEEINRIIPTIKALAKKSKVPISVDTYKSMVAQYALDAGASIINNIKGVHSNKAFLRMVRNYQAAIVLMHIHGTPKTMQRNIFYKNLISDIIAELRKAIENCLEIGIKSDRIIIDPGIGFGKTPEQNLEIIARLKEFRILNQPILMGTSRKSFIGKVLNKEIKDRLMGTAATVCACVLKGAHMVRVHDVRPMKEIIAMTDAILLTDH